MRYFSFDQTIGESKIYGFGGKSGGGTGGKLPLEDYLLTDDGLPAFNYAVVGLVGADTEWDFDTDGKSVRYVVPMPPNPDAPVTGIGWQINSEVLHTREAACRIMHPNNYAGWQNYYDVQATCLRLNPDGITSTSANIYRVDDPSFVAPEPTRTYEYISISTIAEKVVSNAQAGHAISQDAVSKSLPYTVVGGNT